MITDKKLTKFISLIIISLLILMLSSTFISSANEIIDDLEFTEYRGDNYNNTGASYYGIDLGQLKLLLVAGNSDNNASVHMVLKQNSLDMIIVNDGNHTRIRSNLITVITYTNLLVVKSLLDNQTYRLDFSELNWKIFVQKGYTETRDAYLNLDVIANVTNPSILDGTTIKLSFKFSLTRELATLSIPVFIKTEDGYQRSELSKNATAVTTDAKIDHVITGPVLKFMKFVSLGYTVRFVNTIFIPKDVIPPNRTVIPIYENISRPALNFSNNYNFKSQFNWIPTAIVDGETTRVLSTYFDYKYGSLIRFNENRPDLINVYHYLNLFSNFVYRSGASISHDPTLISLNFIELERVIVLLGQSQGKAQLVAMLIISVISIYYAKKK